MIPLGLTAAAAATDATIHKTIFGSGMTILTIPNEEMNHIMEMINSLEKFVLLINDVSKTIKNKGKEQKAGFLNILLDTLGARLIRNLFSGKNHN